MIIFMGAKYIEINIKFIAVIDNFIQIFINILIKNVFCVNIYHGLFKYQKPTICSILYAEIV